MSDALIPIGRSSLEEAGVKEPLELLVVASDRHNVDLAKVALGKITSEHIRSLIGQTTSVQLLRDILSGMMSTGEVRANRQESLRPGMYFTDDWTGIAEIFDPKRFEEGSEDDSDDSDHDSDHDGENTS
ncbi:hypothetical protein I302_103941 [Kwoniella bestiolae CBS 10118]|uniref:Uncharacterized protein n=1 Tax=Kwoniella bestiolae CBS 10118 TaxID=1296100 RepID=A0A1B9G9U2_9TREE|nr:hypothetical protein I302_02647 [Kwoniella bestiolae CBS 10118]OCF27798.1 hypothetical protein I302_02647 [Kwoniella bestiolae CBS 10118]